MKNYKIVIQYDGTKYHGWQRQGNTKNTIQAKFTNVLFRMCGREVELFASGRTDAGVHAKGQVANFKCEVDMTCDEIKDYLNQYLPEDIVVNSVEEAEDCFHSRLHAVSKTYVYQIATKKPDVFIRKYVFATDKKLDVEKMRLAANKLIGRHDFKGFSSVGRTKKSTVRTMNRIVIREESGIVKIQLNANGFLYHMVRIIAGTLMAVGTGDCDETVIDEILKGRKREKAGATLPACGLTLLEVFYN